MPQLDVSFWLGLISAIPLSIFGNLLTPKVQQYIAKRSERKSTERLQAIRCELEELEVLARDPGGMQFEMMRSVLFITFLGAFFGVVSGALAMFSEIIPSAKLLAYSGRVTAILGGVMILQEAFQSLIKARNVKFIDKHREILKQRVRELDNGAP